MAFPPFLPGKNLFPYVYRTAHFPCIFPRLGETGTHFADAAAIKKPRQLKRQSSGAKGEEGKYENGASTTASGK